MYLYNCTVQYCSCTVCDCDSGLFVFILCPNNKLLIPYRSLQYVAAVQLVLLTLANYCRVTIAIPAVLIFSVALVPTRRTTVPYTGTPYHAYRCRSTTTVTC